MSVVVVITVLLILSDYCRLSSASNPVGFEMCFFTLTKKELCILNEKCMKIVFCFLVHGRLFFMFFQPFLRMPALNATDEI